MPDPYIFQCYKKSALMGRGYPNEKSSSNGKSTLLWEEHAVMERCCTNGKSMAKWEERAQERALMKRACSMYLMGWSMLSEKSMRYVMGWGMLCGKSMLF